MRAGIPTLHAGTRFRSRLEARWAAFFGAIGWRWEYEPFDMQGYIPDFLLLGDSPLLVEVKPVTSFRAADEVLQTIPHHPEYPPLVLGCIPFLEGQDECAGAIGQMAGDTDSLWSSVARWSDCVSCRTLRLVPDWLAWTSHPSGCPHRHKPGLLSDATATLISELWADARNQTQWVAS